MFESIYMYKCMYSMSASSRVHWVGNAPPCFLDSSRHDDLNKDWKPFCFDKQSVTFFSWLRRNTYPGEWPVTGHIVHCARNGCFFLQMSGEGIIDEIKRTPHQSPSGVAPMSKHTQTTSKLFARCFTRTIHVALMRCTTKDGVSQDVTVNTGEFYSRYMPSYS